MATVVKTTFKLKRGTAERWEELNPVLAQGEPGFAYDVNILKIGNGIDPWDKLQAINSQSYTISPDENSIAVDINNQIVIYGFADAENNQIPTKGEDGKIKWVTLNQVAFDGIIKLRRDNYFNYEKIQDTFIPANGEICLVDTARDGLRAVCGDGVHTFGELDYIGELLVRGYYYNGNFYTDGSHSEPIVGSTIKIYIDLSKGGLYYFDGEHYQSVGAVGSIPTASSTISGIMKLYDSIGNNTDGTMTQKAITNELDDKVEVSLNLEEEMLIFSN